jgi:hypothetical protein
MKQAKAKHTSRRSFLRTGGQIVVASGVASLGGGCETIQNSRGPERFPKAAPTRARRDAQTQKLRDILPRSGSDTFQEFDGTRPPGWLPDTSQKPAKQEYYFEEEALKLEIITPSNKKLKYFPTPSAGADFNEPGTPDSAGHIPVPDTDSNRLQFNTWILGHPLNPPADPLGLPFFNLLTEIQSRLRRYNAALYWLRRLHFAVNDPYNSPPLPRNPHGDKDDGSPNDPTKPQIPLKSNPKLGVYIRDAQAEWKAAVQASCYTR